MTNKNQQNIPLTRKLRAKYKQRTMLPSASSTGRASICRSTGLASSGLNGAELSLSEGGSFRPGGDVGVVPPDGDVAAFVGEAALLVDLPFRRRRKDSRSDFLKDLRRDIGVSPAPERSIAIKKLSTN